MEDEKEDTLIDHHRPKNMINWPVNASLLKYSSRVNLCCEDNN